MRSPSSQTRPVTMSSSLSIVTNLIRMGISSVCYRRQIFPGDCFENVTQAGCTFKSIVDNSTKARNVCTWLEDGAFDALRKRYLKTLMFGIFVDGTAEPVEAYLFDISYSENTVGLKMSHKGEPVFLQTPRTTRELKTQYIQLLRHIESITTTLKALPPKYHLSIALEYYDHTPEEYEPPKFRPVTDKDNLEFSAKPAKTRLGGLRNQFVQLNVRLKTIVDSIVNGEINRSTTKYPVFSVKKGNPSDSHPSSASSEYLSPSSYTAPPATSPSRLRSPSRSPERSPSLLPRSRSSSPSRTPPASSSSSSSSSSHGTAQGQEKSWVIYPGSQDSSLLSPTLESGSLPPTPEEAAEDSGDAYSRVREAILSEQNATKTFVRKNFPELSPDGVKDIFERLVADGFLLENKGRYKIIADEAAEDTSSVVSRQGDQRLAKACLFALDGRDTITQADLQAHLSSSPRFAKHVLQLMEERGLLEVQTSKNKPRKVIKSEKAEQARHKLLERFGKDSSQSSQSALSSTSSTSAPFNSNSSKNSKSSQLPNPHKPMQTPQSSVDSTISADLNPKKIRSRSPKVPTQFSPVTENNKKRISMQGDDSDERNAPQASTHQERRRTNETTRNKRAKR